MSNMWKINLLCTILIFIIYSESSKAQDPVSTPPPCALRRCSTISGKIVWATGNKKCFVFSNNCLFNLTNCQRRTNNRRALKRVTRKNCQRFCKSACPRIYRPVCGQSADSTGAYQTFSNRCVMEARICETGNIFNFLGNGNCDDLFSSSY